MTLYWLAGLFATLLILALAGYAALLWRRVAQQEKARQQQQGGNKGFHQSCPHFMASKMGLRVLAQTSGLMSPTWR